MSNQFNSKKHSLNPIKEENSYDSSNIKEKKDNIDPYTKNSLEMIKQHFYPPSYSLPALTPSITKKNYRSNNSQKRPMSKKLFKENKSKYLNIFDSGVKKKLLSEKTEVSLINKNLGQYNEKIKNMNEVNKITNIKKHINKQNSNKTLDNKSKAQLIKNNNNDNMNNLQNPLFRDKKNKLNKCSSHLINNAEMIINLNIIGFKKNNFYNKKVKDKNGVKGNIKIMPPSSIIDTNKNINKLSSIGKLIMNNNNKNILHAINQNKKMNTQKYSGNIFPDNINMEKGDNTNKKSFNLDKDLIILLNKGNNSLTSQELEDIDNHNFFLKNLRNNRIFFGRFLQLIENHMNIELLLNTIYNCGRFDQEFFVESLSNLFDLINEFFKTLYLIYNDYNNKNNDCIVQNNSQNKTDDLDNFFLYQSLNYIFHKTIKVQICLFSFNLMTMLKEENYDFYKIKVFHQIIKDISNPLFSIFKNFILEEIKEYYFEIFTNNLRPDFFEDFNKLHKIQKFTQKLKHSELIILILKQLDKSINSLEYYSNYYLKNSSLSPFGEAFNQLLYSLESKTLNQFMTIIFNTLLFSEFYDNIKINYIIPSNLGKDTSNIQMGSSIVNRVNDFPPFLPSINPKYKYTLVLDLDETLIHYFLPEIDFVFFVRPYCFDFFEELNDLYEIIIFTEGTIETDDLFLNWLDIDNKFIKYRLYSKHMNCFGVDNYYKDLNTIGRDLSKVIIIDNLKENFKMHPYNGILIKSWINDINDLELRDLSKILKDIVTLKVNDVRPVIRKINDEIKIRKNEKRPYENINVAKLIGENKPEVLKLKQEFVIPNNDLITNNTEEIKDNNSNIVNAENNKN